MGTATGMGTTEVTTITTIMATADTTTTAEDIEATTITTMVRTKFYLLMSLDVFLITCLGQYYG